MKTPWRHPDGSICHIYVLLAGMALLLATYSALPANIWMGLLVLLPGLLIAWLAKALEWQQQQLDAAVGALQLVAVLGCHCKSAPEGYECYVCYARGVLRQHFPDKLNDLKSG